MGASLFGAVQATRGYNKHCRSVTVWEYAWQPLRFSSKINELLMSGPGFVQDWKPMLHERRSQDVVDILQHIMWLSPQSREQYLTVEATNATCNNLHRLVSQHVT